MAHRSDFNEQAHTFEKIIYPETSRMNNYDIIYDESIQQMRCGLYTNRNIDVISNTDTVYTVEPGYEHRLDLISLKFYETALFDWFIADANNIEDPIKDVVAGTKLVIPDRAKRK